MNRPAAEQFTERELEVMHIFWGNGELTAQAARDQMEREGRSLTYTTVATLCKILWEKGFWNGSSRIASVHVQGDEVVRRSLGAFCLGSRAESISRIARTAVCCISSATKS